jgi:predicted nuclease of predicted toxin-antitoxin system
MRLIQKYQDLPASVADASLLYVYNSTKQAIIMTLDSDFLIYRAKNGKPPTLIAPF